MYAVVVTPILPRKNLFFSHCWAKYNEQSTHPEKKKLIKFEQYKVNFKLFTVFASFSIKLSISLFKTVAEVFFVRSCSVIS